MLIIGKKKIKKNIERVRKRVERKIEWYSFDEL